MSFQLHHLRRRTTSIGSFSDDDDFGDNSGGVGLSKVSVFSVCGQQNLEGLELRQHRVFSGAAVHECAHRSVLPEAGVIGHAWNSLIEPIQIVSSHFLFCLSQDVRRTDKN